MLKKISIFFLVLIIISAFGGLTGYGAEDPGMGVSGEAYHNEKGLSHFKKGFYSLTPQHRKKEASQEYGLAIQEFKKALAINPANAETHRNLARVYYIQKKFLQAAEHYKKLTELDPYDIDSYVLTALAYAEAQRYAEARVQLEIAKNMTADLRIIEKLDGYLEKLDQQRQ
jgi:tetratricopeptide (TPR) repeat protein